jgi:hypothetical protein
MSRHKAVPIIKEMCIAGWRLLLVDTPRGLLPMLVSEKGSHLIAF